MLETNSKKVEKLERILTFNEFKAIKGIKKKLGISREGEIKGTAIAKELGIAHSSIKTALRIMEAAEVVEVTGMGTKGTYINVIDRETFAKIGGEDGEK